MCLCMVLYFIYNEMCNRYKFYSSSVLFVWDGSSVSSDSVRVKLVDFAHTYPNKPGDNTLDLNSLEVITCLLM
jgi:hypothetical protein